MNDFPDYLPNTYDQYYLYPEYKASHLNPEYTRADEVKDSHEKRKRRSLPLLDLSAILAADSLTT